MKTDREASTRHLEQVRAYLAALPPRARRRMQQMRTTICSAAPDAVEHFSYRIPGFRLDGKVFVYYAAFKAHTSLYPMGAAIRRAHASALKGYKMSTGTIQFPLDRPLPVALVRRLIRARIAEVRERA
jgi:uncharacterized protein YdhG (YjbR/CyaY superfamily)